MIARPTDITHTGPSAPDPSTGQSPMQRQILLWQRELLRRAELKRNSQAVEPVVLPQDIESD